ncbi:hypothetical protein MASR1M59_14400 [Melaminivora sp.]
MSDWRKPARKPAPRPRYSGNLPPSHCCNSCAGIGRASGGQKSSPAPDRSPAGAEAGAGAATHAIAARLSAANTITTMNSKKPFKLEADGWVLLQASRKHAPMP